MGKQAQSLFQLLYNLNKLFGGKFGTCSDLFTLHFYSDEFNINHQR